jgi:hypothetical protein
MTCDVLTFLITSQRTGQLLGVALLSLEARYAAVLWTGAEGVDRRSAPPADWKELALELQLGWQPGPIPASTTVARLIAGDQLGLSTVLLEGAESVTAERPETVPGTLDKKLSEVAKRARHPVVDGKTDCD